MATKAKLKVNVPTTIVIFGVTGDLSQRKLIPALLDLYVKGLLPEIFEIVGFSRRPMTSEQLRQFMKAAINRKKHHHKPKIISQFLKHATYKQGNFDDSQA